MVCSAAITYHNIFLATMTYKSANSLPLHTKLKTNTMGIVNEVESADWTNVCGTDDPDVAANEFNKII